MICTDIINYWLDITFMTKMIVGIFVTKSMDKSYRTFSDLSEKSEMDLIALWKTKK